MALQIAQPVDSPRFGSTARVTASQFFPRTAKRCAILNLSLIVLITATISFSLDSQAIAEIHGVIACLVALYPLMAAIKTRRFEFALSAFVFVNVSPIWFLYLEGVLKGHDAHDVIDPQTRLYAFIYASLFVLLVNAYYSLAWTRVSKVAARIFGSMSTTDFTAETYSVLTVLAFATPIIAFAIYYGSFDQIWNNVTAGRANGSGSILKQSSVGDSSSILLPLVWLWQLPPVFGIIAFTKAKNKLSPFAAVPLLLGGVTIFSAFLSGSRGNLTYVAAPYIFFLVYYNWHRGIKFWLSVVALFFFVIAAMEIQVRFRGNLLDVLSDPDGAAKSQQLDSITTFDPTKSHRDNNMYIFCLAIRGYPERYDFEGFNDFFAVLLNPIPRFLWPDKPVLVGAKGLEDQPDFILDGPLTMGTTSLSMSVVGEAYRANGIWGIAVYALAYGIFALVIDGLQRLEHKAPVLVSMLAFGAFLSFWGMRSFFAMVTFLYPFVLLLLILKLISTTKKLL